MKKDTIQKLKEKLKRNGANSIQTSLGKTDKPSSLSFKGGRKSYMPDIVAEFENKTDLFSIEHKISKSGWPDLISKWILFGLEARKNGGHFYVVVSKDNSKQCKEIIAAKRLSAELITI